jgi:hypothetical protein
MKRIVLLLLTLALALAAHAADAPAPPAQPAATDLKIEDTKAFFDDYLSKKDPPPRGEFETTEEYQKRIPKYPKLTGIYYFSVPYSSSRKQYTYNADTQTMMVIGDYLSLPSEKERYFCSQGKLVDRVYRTDGYCNSYTATNAYGAQVTVTVETATDYKFCYANLTCIPPELVDGKLTGNDSVKLIIPVHLDPKAAEAFSKNIETIIGVRPIDYSRSIRTQRFIKATFDSPSDFTYNSLLIEANLVKFILRNSATKEIVAQYDIPESAPAAQ